MIHVTFDRNLLPSSSYVVVSTLLSPPVFVIALLDRTAYRSSLYNEHLLIKAKETSNTFSQKDSQKLSKQRKDYN